MGLVGRGNKEQQEINMVTALLLWAESSRDSGGEEGPETYSHRSHWGYAGSRHQRYEETEGRLNIQTRFQVLTKETRKELQQRSLSRKNISLNITLSLILLWNSHHIFFFSFNEHSQFSKTLKREAELNFNLFPKSSKGERQQTQFVTTAASHKWGSVLNDWGSTAGNFCSLSYKLQ